MKNFIVLKKVLIRMNNNIISFKILDNLKVKNYYFGKEVNYLEYISNKENVYSCKQNHTSNVVVVYKNDDRNDIKFENVDALITSEKDFTLLIKTADCQSIFIYDKVNKVIANVHSGWRGTLDLIVIKTINKMKETFNSKEKDLIVCINPSINKCHFEIEIDVLNEFKNKMNFDISNFYEKGNKEGKYYLDLIELNKKILINNGIKKENIYVSNICTYCKNDLFYSYRYDKTLNRNISTISL